MLIFIYRYVFSERKPSKCSWSLGIKPITMVTICTWMEHSYLPKYQSGAPFVQHLLGYISRETVKRSPRNLTIQESIWTLYNAFLEVTHWAERVPTLNSRNPQILAGIKWCRWGFGVLNADASASSTSSSPIGIGSLTILFGRLHSTYISPPD